MKFLTFCFDSYIPQRSIRRSGHWRYRSIANGLAAMLGCKPEDVDLADLTDDNVNTWLQWECQHGHRTTPTLVQYRFAVLSVWKIAWKSGLVELPPRNVLMKEALFVTADGKVRQPMPRPDTSENVKLPDGNATSETLLKELAQLYILQRTLSRKSEENILRNIRRFDEFSGGSLKVGELTEPLVSEFVKSMQDREFSPHTIKSRRADIITLWRFAADADLVADPNTRRIRNVKTAALIPTAWDRANVARLLGACARLDGVFQKSKLPRKLVMRAWILTSWDSGLRPWCDQLRLRRSWIQEGGRVTVIQSKTQVPHTFRLRPETIEAIEAIAQPDTDEIFASTGYKALYYGWQRVAEMSGIEGPPKRMRASRATDAEREQPGSAPSVLGHKPGSTVAYKSYVDPRIARRDVPMPPPIEGEANTTRRS